MPTVEAVSFVLAVRFKDVIRNAPTLTAPLDVGIHLQLLQLLLGALDFRLGRLGSR